MRMGAAACDLLHLDYYIKTTRGRNGEIKHVSL